MKLPELPKLTPAFRAHRLEWLSGSYQDLTHDLQLLLLIQPNCPGCHVHAVPVANSIAACRNDFDIYCVSTAFEDFEYNTKENARLLLEGKLVGFSAQTLGDTIAEVPQIPMAHDHVVDTDHADEDLREWAFEAMVENARSQLEGMGASEDAIESTLERLDHTALPSKLAELFWSVKARGSPTWVLHRQDGQVLDVLFGYMEEKEIRQWITRVAPSHYTSV